MHQITFDELNFGPLNITTDLMVRYRYIERYSIFVGRREGTYREILSINISATKRAKSCQTFAFLNSQMQCNIDECNFYSLTVRESDVKFLKSH